MTDREHAELSRRLALALGYMPINVQTCNDHALVYGLWTDILRPWGYWRRFDYRDPTVALLLLKHFGVSNSLNVWSSGPTWWNWSTGDGFDGVCATIEEAIALAVIAVKEKT